MRLRESAGNDSNTGEFSGDGKSGTKAVEVTANVDTEFPSGNVRD